MKVVFVRGVVSAGLIALLCFSYSASPGTFSLPGLSTCPSGDACVYYLNIGQGDATLIESPTGTRFLLDGGPNGSVLRQLSKHMSFFERSLDAILATHPDKDHIAGFVDVLKRYDVKNIIVTEDTSDTSVSKLFRKRIKEERGANIINARRGQVYDLGGGTYLEVLFPDRNTDGLVTNTASIVSRLTYGDTSFLFMGDSPKAVESYLISLYGGSLKTDILKVGHHGSRNSSGEEYIKTVAPAYAMISAGKNNIYGHPHKEVLDILDKYHVTYENTADVGTITAVSDGQHVKVE
jgi:competence protein ComEC